MALQTGILVAFTQLIPEHQVQVFGVLKVRVKRLPMAYVGFSNVMCLVGFLSPYILIQFGWLVSWAYLRFYKRTSIEGASTVSGIETWGDRSETFAFVHWFPPFVHYPVGILCDVAYKGAVQLKLVREYPSTDLEAGGYAQLGSGNARAEAERRRAMALRALDQRMAASNASNKPSRPAPTEANGESSAGPSRTPGNEQPSAKPAPESKA
ncbi:hypothetical protein FRC02_001768 [Tulasnella sp. 418]|nr:hypothetical protein FRC02_001768 [Tulasnella sp. 418]